MAPATRTRRRLRRGDQGIGSVVSGTRQGARARVRGYAGTPIGSLDEALALPGTILAPFDDQQPLLNDLEAAVLATKSRVDDELAVAAVEPLALPVEVFYHSRSSRTTRPARSPWSDSQQLRSARLWTSRSSVLVTAGEDEAIGYLHSTDSTMGSLDTLFNSLRSSRHNAVVPSAALTSLPPLTYLSQGGNDETTILPHVPSVNVSEKIYFPAAQKLHPHGRSLTPHSATSSPAGVPSSPGRLVYRLDPEILARFGLPTLAISHSATAMAVVPFNAEHLPVRWLTRSLGPGFLHRWPLKEDTQATLGTKWQVRKLQEAHRQAIAGVAPHIVARNFYAGINDPEVAPVALPLVSNARSKNTTAAPPSTRSASAKQITLSARERHWAATDAAKVLTSKVVDGAAVDGMPQANRAVAEQEETLSQVSAEWYE